MGKRLKLKLKPG